MVDKLKRNTKSKSKLDEDKKGMISQYMTLKYSEIFNLFKIFRICNYKMAGRKNLF